MSDITEREKRRQSIEVLNHRIATAIRLAFVNRTQGEEHIADEQMDLALHLRAQRRVLERLQQKRRE